MANKSDQRIYVQSAFAMPDADKENQEQASLLRIGDNFKKIIVVKDDIIPYYNEQGIQIVGLAEFLIDKKYML